MNKCSCQCADANACAALPPVIEAARAVVLDSGNCQRTLVPTPGSVIYSDGNKVYYADGSAARPLGFPSLITINAEDGTEVPSIIFQTQAGVIGSLAAPAADQLYIYSSGGEWTVGEIPVVTSWPVGSIPEECCCPAAFAVLTLSEDEETYELKRFNPCEDATTVTSGPILTCEDGCMRKLAGTDNDQVPVWDTGTSEWVPTDISELVPTPESVLDVAYFNFSQTGNQATLPTYSRAFNFYPYGTGASWSISQSSTIINSASVATPYITHNAIRVINAGWHRVDFTVNGTFAIAAGNVSLANTVVSAFVEAQHTGAAQTFEFYGLGDTASSGELPTTSNAVRFAITGSYAKNFTANEDIDIVHNLTFNTATGSSETPSADFTFTFRCQGTVTRIT